MSSQATVQNSLSLSGGLSYRSTPGAFNATVAGSNGPTPGAVTVPASGVDITFAQLTKFGGIGRFYNIDQTNFITIGIRDKTNNTFYPFMDVPPQETYTLRLSSKLPKEEVGTGTFAGSGAVVHAKTNGGASAILVCEFFDP